MMASLPALLGRCLLLAASLVALANPSAAQTPEASPAIPAESTAPDASSRGAESSSDRGVSPAPSFVSPSDSLPQATSSPADSAAQPPEPSTSDSALSPKPATRSAEPVAPAFSAPATAPKQPIDPPPPAPPAASAGRVAPSPPSTDSAQPLTLEEASLRAIRRNRELRESRLQWLASRRSARATWGDWEPRLVAGYLHKEQGREDEPFPEERSEYRASLQGTLPTATRYDIGWQENALRHSKSLSEASASVTLRQPVLRGLWYGAPWAARRSALAQERRAFHQYRSLLMSIVAKTHTAFWDTHTAGRLLESESQSVAVARDLLTDGVRRAQLGLISALDLERLSAELALRMAREIDARRQLQEAGRSLDLLLADSAPPGPGPRNLAPPLSVSDSVALSPGRVDSLATEQPDCLSMQAEIDRLATERDVHRAQRLPRVDLTGSWGYGGTSRNATAARQKFESPELRDRVISGGIEIEIPLLLDLKESNLARAGKLTVRAAEFRKGQIVAQWRGNARTLLERAETQRHAARLQAEVVAYHRRALESEIRKIRSGKSNYQLVYEIEEKLRDAERGELEAIRGHHIARVELARATGTLLVEAGLETRDAESGWQVRSDLSEP